MTDPTRLVHTRSAAHLKGKFNHLKAELTKWQSNYTASVNHDADNRVQFVSHDNMEMLCARLFLHTTSILDTFIRGLPDGIGAKDRSGAASSRRNIP